MRNRKPDLRRIRGGTCYTIPELANLLGVAVATVRSWIRAGLPRLDDGKPYLLPGDEVRAWLKSRQATRKQKCQADEIYCLGCRSPRKPVPGSVSILPRNRKTTMIKGICSVCGASICRGGSVERIAESALNFGVSTMGQANLLVSVNPILKYHIQEEAAE